MKHPKLKHSLLCRILPYIVVAGLPVAFIVAVTLMKGINDVLKVILLFGTLVGILVYILKNFATLFLLDMVIAQLHCRINARKSFDLGISRLKGDKKRIDKRISRFGYDCEEEAIEPKPYMLRYKLTHSMTVYTKGIEKIIAAYETDLLDKETYRRICTSAVTNSRALRNTKKPLIIDKAQKKAPLNRVTVAVVFANRVESSLKKNLYDTVCKQLGEGNDNAFLPCIIDMSDKRCVFSSERLPFLGYQYPVKNRGCNIIEKIVFGASPSLKNNRDTLPPIKDIDPEESLWSLWRRLGTTVDEEFNRKGDKKLGFLKVMDNREVKEKGNELYVKLNGRGVRLGMTVYEQSKTAKLEPILFWCYPKKNKVSKADCKELQEILNEYFSKKGYSFEFKDFNE